MHCSLQQCTPNSLIVYLFKQKKRKTKNKKQNKRPNKKQNKTKKNQTKKKDFQLN